MGAQYRAMSPGGLPEVPWLTPLPLEGVKSRKRAVFDVPKAYLKNKTKQSANTFSGLKLALESRIAVVGDKLGCITDLLLGASELVSGTLSRHDGLSVLHLGPQLLDTVGQSAAEYLAASAAALEKRPQVVILDEADGVENEAWHQAFHYLLDHHRMQEFRGALVICVAEETPAIRRICTHRWTGACEWFWQEFIEEDSGLEFSEDVLNMPGQEVLIQEVRDLAWQKPFVEDIIEKAKANDWNVTVLTKSSSLGAEKAVLQDSVQHDLCCPSSEEQSGAGAMNTDQSKGQRSLAGFICYTIRDGTFIIARLAVVEPLRSSGYGRRMLRFALEKAAQMQHSEVAWIGVSALDTAVPFYERFGFMDMTADDIECDEHFQTWMEMPNTSAVSANAVSVAPPLA